MACDTSTYCYDVFYISYPSYYHHNNILLMNKLFLLGCFIVGFMVFLMVRFPHTLLSPGELTESHQKINNDCFACHAPMQGVTNNKCISCHKLNEIGLKTNNSAITHTDKSKISFHEVLKMQSCTSCHSDHQGIYTTPNAGSFKHNLITESIVNNCLNCHEEYHDELHSSVTSSCKNCHNFESWKTITHFDHNLINTGKDKNCLACHKKPDDALHTAVTNNCFTCHTLTEWKPATFEHNSYFVLDGDHNTDCVTCHKNNKFDSYTCYGCHEHTPGNIASEHREEGINDIKDCVRCHKSADEDNVLQVGKSEKKEKNKQNDDD